MENNVDRKAGWEGLTKVERKDDNGR
jgi:hypothetical protein